MDDIDNLKKNIRDFKMGPVRIHLNGISNIKRMDVQISLVFFYKSELQEFHLAEIIYFNPFIEFY